MRRNRITPKHAEDLVSAHSNLRLLSRRRPEYTTGESKKWETSIVENNDYVDDNDVVVL